MNDSLRKTFRESITFKFALVGILVLIMLIPAEFIKSLIRDREFYRNQVVMEVSDQWAGRQEIVGPFIVVPFVEIVHQNGISSNQKQFMYFLPEQLKVSGNIDPEIRKRSIYEVMVYNARLKFMGHFLPPDLSIANVSRQQILFDEARLVVGLGDLKGVNEEIFIKVNGMDKAIETGIPSGTLLGRGFSIPIQLSDDTNYNFEFSLNINGSQGFFMTPVGKKTELSLHSEWPHPSFSGTFLPKTSNISAEGFSADWLVLDINRNFPQSWSRNDYYTDEALFGVNLIVPVDLYQKSERSAKYAIMFLALTFLVFFFSEMINERKIHPIQYLLVGVALSVFYVLLIALAEQMGFNLAYLIASAANILLIGSFASSILKNRKSSIFIFLTLIILYFFLYVLLQQEDYALLIGSIGLFLVVAITMIVSRKIDWYNYGKR